MYSNSSEGAADGLELLQIGEEIAQRAQMSGQCPFTTSTTTTNEQAFQGIPILGMSNGMPIGVSNGMHNGVHNGMSIGVSNGMPNGVHNGMPTGAHNGMPNLMPNGVPTGMPNVIPNGIPNGMSNRVPNGILNGIPNVMPIGIPNRVPNGMPKGMPNGVPNGICNASASNATSSNGCIATGAQVSTNWHPLDGGGIANGRCSQTNPSNAFKFPS